MMVESAPSSAFVVIETDLLLQVLEVALDAPAQLGRVDEGCDRRRARQRREPVLGGRRLALRPLDQQPLLGPRLGTPVIPMRWSHPHSRKPRGKITLAALAPAHSLPSLARQSQGELAGLHRLGTAVSTQQLRLPAAAAPWSGRQWLGSRRPHRDRALHADDVGQLHLGQRVTKGRVVAVARIGKRYTLWHAVSDRPAYLAERDLRLGLEGDLSRHAGLLAALLVVGPRFGEIETHGNRQARLVAGHRQCHRHLAVVLLAELAAVLARNPDGMLALLGDAGVVDDPRPDRRPGF